MLSTSAAGGKRGGKGRRVWFRLCSRSRRRTPQQGAADRGGRRMAGAGAKKSHDRNGRGVEPRRCGILHGKGRDYFNKGKGFRRKNKGAFCYFESRRRARRVQRPPPARKSGTRRKSSAYTRQNKRPPLRKEQPPARNRESRQTTTTAESGGGGLVSAFAPPYGEDEPPAFLIGTKTPKRGHEGRIIGTKGAKRGHENAGKASTPPKPRPRVVLSSCISLHCKPAPPTSSGAKIEQPRKGKASTPRPPYHRSRTRQKWKKTD